MAFNGFTPETVDFLWGIRMNNNREWFMANKPSYVNHLYEPMKSLGQELFQPFLDKPGNVLKVSRIYRDARMHHDVPYKESLWICIRKDVEWWAENPCLYFEICPDGISYGFIFYRPRPAVMEQIRRNIAGQPRKFRNLIRDTETATGMTISAETYKKPKPGFTAETERFFTWKSCIACVVDEPFSQASFGPQLAHRVRAHLTNLIPLYDFFNQFTV